MDPLLALCLQTLREQVEQSGSDSQWSFFKQKSLDNQHVLTLLENAFTYASEVAYSRADALQRLLLSERGDHG
jgi:hypothetical protein